MCFDINGFAFEYGDSEYFNWFRNPNQDTLETVIRWKRLSRVGVFELIMAGAWWASWDAENQQLEIHDEELSNLEWPVTRAFLKHLTRPIEYPILDQNAFRAMRILSEHWHQDWHERVHQNITDWQKDYLGGYKSFFQGLYEERNEEIQVPVVEGVDAEIVRRRMLDRALWEYGRIHT